MGRRPPKRRERVTLAEMPRGGPVIFGSVELKFAESLLDEAEERLADAPVPKRRDGIDG